MTSYHLPVRPRRLRQSQAARALVQQTRLHANQLIAPLFINATLNQAREVASMPGQFQWPVTAIHEEIDALSALGVNAVLLFGVPAYKDSRGSSAWQDDGIIQQAIRSIKRSHPHMLVIADLCFCEYMDHGHCGLACEQVIENDETLALLGQQAVSLAHAGADWVAPSGMMDGMVAAVRQALDQAGFQHTAILSYSAKYCSGLYGPFREATEGAPQFGDRKTYQMDPANSDEALREAALDIAEGADLLMVKPASYYLDIIFKLKQRYPELPLCAYQVSGEYSMIKLAAKQGLIDEQRVMLESLLAIKRAGADLIISYFAKDLAKFLKQSPFAV